MSKLGFEGEWMIDGINKIKKTLKAILRAIIFTHRAIEYWDVIADFITDNEVNDTFSSMLGYQQKIYHYHAIIELSKIYDRDNRTLSLPNLNLPIDIILYNNNYFDLYSNKNEFTEAVKFLKDSRNIWAAHNEAPLDTKNRGKQYEGVISIASLERLLKCTKRLYTEIINFTQVDHFDPDIEYRSPESICFKNLLIKSLEH